MASTTDHEPQLSRTARFLVWIVVPLLLVALFALSPQTAGFSILILAAPTSFCWHVSKTSRGSLELLLWTACGTASIGLAVVGAAQGLLCQSLGYLCFGDQVNDYFEQFTRASIDGLSDTELQKRAQMAWTWQYLTFLVVFTYVLAGFLEELLKYLAIIIARRFSTKLSERDYLYMAIASTLGFSTVENIGFVYAARDQGLIMVGMTVIERVAIGMPAHALSGCLIALAIVRRDCRKERLSYAHILGPATLYHGTFDFLLFAVSAWNGNVGWVHPKDVGSLAVALSGITCILMLAYLHVRREAVQLGPRFSESS